MRDAEQQPGSGWYEVTVLGPVGAVVRRALGPCRTGPLQQQTIIRARAHVDVDLVDVAAHLHAHGSTVAGISILQDGAARTAGTSAPPER